MPSFCGDFVHCVFDLTKPTIIAELFDQWCGGGGSKYKTCLLTAAADLWLTIWLSRNEVVFDKCKPKTFLQVLFRERSGSGSGRHYIALRKTRRSCGKFANYLKGQLSNSSLPLDGYRQVV